MCSTGSSCPTCFCYIKCTEYLNTKTFLYGGSTTVSSKSEFLTTTWLTKSDIQIDDIQNRQKYASDLYNNPFPITQDVIDQIPASAKKSESRFVASLLRLMYTDHYLGTHTMAANLTGKKNMDDKELARIISKLYISINAIFYFKSFMFLQTILEATSDFFLFKA